ncbi:NADPH-dependent alcohol dehydrogenase [Mrakia frigida]|uniref:NAD(P)-dependent alcohol dehydrogenase n=1 Tax=Mrakia frigida TaxID=29902 RepID=UPI003FCC19D3
MTAQAQGYAIHDTSKPTEFKLISYDLKTAEDNDVDIAIEYCGVCGSDVHTITAGWGPPILPCVVGHEVVGRVSRVGPKVTEFKVGDHVGVGAAVWSDGDCDQCTHDNEQYCPKKVFTYNARYENGDLATGGYADSIRVNDRFVFGIPEGMSGAEAAPLMCAGLTVYSPMVRNNVGPGSKVGIVGIGGLGHIAIQFAKALGAEVFAFTHSLKKKDDILAMGADHIIVTGGGEEFEKKHAFELDFLLTTVDSVDGLPLDKLIKCVNINGTIITVGIPAGGMLPPISAMSFLGNGCHLGSSLLGSKKEAVAMLQLAHEKGVKPWIQEIPMSRAAEAVNGVRDGSVRYRYVLKNDIPPRA